MKNTDAIRNAVTLAGGATQLARALGTRQSAVSNWIMRGQIPAHRVKDIAAATGWQVRPHDLRPDLWPKPTDAMPEI